MSDVKIYDVKPAIAMQAHITAETYKTMYQQQFSLWENTVNQSVITITSL